MNRDYSRYPTRKKMADGAVFISHLFQYHKEVDCKALLHVFCIHIRCCQQTPLFWEKISLTWDCLHKLTTLLMIWYSNRWMDLNNFLLCTYGMLPRFSYLLIFCLHCKTKLFCLLKIQIQVCEENMLNHLVSALMSHWSKDHHVIEMKGVG